MNSYSHNDFRSRPRRTTLELPSRVGHEPQQITARTLSSESLFNGAYEIGIAHAGSLYRLKITRQGKLILNK